MSKDPISEITLGEPYGFTDFDCQTIIMESDGECINDVNVFYLGTQGNSEGITGFEYTTNTGNVGTVGQKTENRDQTLEEFNKFYNKLDFVMRSPE